MSKNLKKTIAGKIPTDWNALLIKAFSSVVRGGSPRPAGSPKYFNGDFIPWITVADVTRVDGMYLTQTKSMLTEEGAKHTRIIEPDTLLISNSGATLGVPRISKIRAGANDGVAMILSPDGVTNTYLYHFLSSKTDFLREQAAPGNGQPNLNTDIIGGIAVPIPPLAEQTAIASLLSTWDIAIEKAVQLIVAKEKRYIFLLSHLVSNSSFLYVHIRDFTAEVSRRNVGALIDRVLSVTNRNGFILPEDQFARRVASSDLSNYKIVTGGQYAYNPSRINVGSIARLDNWETGVLSPMYVVFKLDETRASSDFFLHWLESHEAKQRISKSAQGSVRETVSFGDFGAIPFPLPPIEKQKQIAAILTTARQEINLLKMQAEAYRKQKRGLMQRLLTGEWRVKAVEETEQ